MTHRRVFKEQGQGCEWERMEAGGPTSLVYRVRRYSLLWGGPWEAGEGHPAQEEAGLQGCAGTACGQQRQGGLR